MAEIDIVPELLAQIQQDFNQAYKNDTKIQQLADKISSGKADYADAQEFAQRTGELMAAALQKNITADKLPNGQMYYNIADRILGTMLKTDYGIVAKKAAEVQQHLNENAGLGLKAQTADYDEENAKNIIDKVSASEDFNTVSYMLKAPVETFSMRVVDDTIKKNADFHYKAGLKPRIVRTAEAKCCDWCASLDGTYEYPGVPKEVFARHNNCRCTVNYDPRDGKVQNVWNKKEWKDAEEYDKIELRKTLSADDDIIIDRIINRIDRVSFLSSIPDYNRINIEENLSRIGLIPNNWFFENVDKRLQTIITDQLTILEDRFSACKRNHDYIHIIQYKGKNGAAVSTNKSLSRSRYLKLGDSFSSIDEQIKIVRASVKSKEYMPCKNDANNLSRYIVTHEYGHILENALIAEDRRYTPGSHEYYCDYYMRQIETIATELDSNYSREKYLSKYAANKINTQNASGEFFAECFANSQLNDENVLGKAMNIWLQNRGF